MAERSNIVRITRSLSTGSFEIGENGARVFSRRTVPHYLRPSRGSCHDLCKYGRRRAFEEEVIVKSVRKRDVKPELGYVKMAVSGEQNKEKISPDAKSSVSNVRASSDAKIYPRNLDASSGRKYRLPARKSASPDTIKVIEVRAEDDDKLSRGNKKTFDVDSSHERLKLVKVKPPFTWDNSDGKGRRNSDIQTSRKMSASARKCESTPAFPKSSVCKTERRYKGVKLDRNRVDGFITGTSNSKTLLETEAGTRKNSLSPLSDSNPSMSFHDEGTKCCSNGTDKLETAVDMVEPVEENHQLSEVRTKENILESSPVHLPYENMTIHENYDTAIKYSGSDKDECSGDNIVSTEIEPVKENQNMRMEEIENNELQSTPNGHVIPSPSLLSDDEETNNIGNEPLNVEIIKKSPLKGKHNENPRKIREYSSGDKYSRSMKLRFRSGKVMDLHQDNNTPRRLIFKRRRSSVNKLELSVSDNNKYSFKVQPVNKASRKSRIIAPEDKTRSPLRLLRSEKWASLQSNNNISRRLRLRRAKPTDVKGDCKGSSKNYGGGDNVNITVNLKHQDVQMKKDGQCLLNNVIEATTSKLVESRKSKVKALVGAFETVISLQERKPSLHTAT